MKILVVVDMQYDFTYGALRNEHGISIIPNVVKKVEESYKAGDFVIFTKDTHEEDYLETEEGRNLPVPHCIEDTDGWMIVDELKSLAKIVFCKDTFGSVDLGEELARLVRDNDNIDEIEFVGICTDICVISNALLAKAFVPNIQISVDASCCAGVTAQSHETALSAMEACHIKIKNR